MCLLSPPKYYLNKKKIFFKITTGIELGTGLGQVLDIASTSKYKYFWFSQVQVQVQVLKSTWPYQVSTSTFQSSTSTSTFDITNGWLIRVVCSTIQMVVLEVSTPTPPPHHLIYLYDRYLLNWNNSVTDTIIFSIVLTESRPQRPRLSRVRARLGSSLTGLQ